MRYNKVLDKNIREIVLLKSFPCSYGKCKFCNYIEDNSIDKDEINKVNFGVLEEVTGEFGVLEVINSGSVFEIPSETLKKIREVVKAKNIKILYKRLDEIRDYFHGVEIRFRVGVETFDDRYRIDSYGKNFVIDKVTLKKLRDEFYSACLLVCTVGQTEEMITKDIEIGLANFKQITINVFIDNGTEVRQDKKLVHWLMEKYSHLKADPSVELLYDNKDLGVFEQ